ncbi:MAG: LuxR C-terminal-related transcriptional regulator [Gaiellaceae bacterium]
MAVEARAARQRIIRRPRLTSMLEESSARIRLLVAAAGYGKTTLAREWLDNSERQGAWYRCGPASADVAALAVGIAETASAILPNAGTRMRDRLRATGHPEEDVHILAELIAEDMREWPSDAWLLFDDYHHAMDSVASERFVELLARDTPVQILITSRRRPSWATARQIMYGEILEIDRRALAMEDPEAREVLGRDNEATNELIVRARGWPAVLGLAAMTEEFVLPPDDLPATLHAYFAEEVLQATDPQAGRALAKLAVAPTITPQLVATVLGTQPANVIGVGVRLGVLSEQAADSFAMHPLLRDFLQSHFNDEPDRADLVLRIGDYFLERGEWDNAFEVALTASLPAVLEKTIESGLDPMLANGRLATVEKWVEYALRSHFDMPIVDLAEAELAFRQGEHARAYTLASQAAARFGDEDLAARAHARAGHSALLSSREKEGLTHFRSARDLAQTWQHRREALVGLYFAASELLDPDALSAFEELQASGERTPDGILRMEVLRLTHAARTGGGIEQSVSSALPKLHLIERATDPLGLTAFVHALSTSLNVSARYAEALALADQQFDLATRYRLDLPVVHGRLNQAISYLGLGNFRRADEALRKVRERLPSTGDPYLETTLRAITCRLLTGQKRFDEAVSLTEDAGESISSPLLRAEYMCSRALALACSGQPSAARSLAEQSRAAFSSSIETRVLAPCVEAIIAVQSRNEAERARTVLNAWHAAEETGNFDSYVGAFRAMPEILHPLIHNPEVRHEVADLFVRLGEEEAGRRLGLWIQRTGPEDIETLTPRERDVLRELEQGSSNRDIASRLFISEATVKVHLRHIYEKLGVRTRAEVLARATMRR